MEKLNKMVRMIEFISWAMFVLSAIAVCALFLLLFADVSGRFLFDLSITGSPDFSQYLLVAIAFLSLGYAQLTGTHINVNTIIRLFPQKVKIVIQTITTLTAMVFFIVMSIQIGTRCYLDWADKILTTISMVRLPVWWASFMATVGCILLVFSLFAQFLKIVFGLSEENGGE